MMGTVCHAELAERDIAGTAIATAFGAKLVVELVEMDTIYDPRIRRVIEAAIALPDDLDVDFTKFDDGGVIGPHIVIDGMAITGTALVRMVAIATAVGDSISRIAQVGADLPCRRSLRWVERLVAEVADASERRAALAVLDEARGSLLEGVPVVETPALAVLGLAVADHLDPVPAGEVLRRTAA